MDPKPSEIANQLLDVTNSASDDLDETAKEFLEQNIVISKEIQKYDDMLSTGSMLLYRIWLIFYFVCNAISPFYLAMYILRMGQLNDIWGYLSLLLKCVFVIVALRTAWGCFLVRNAILTKSLEKIEKGIFLFKFNFVASLFHVVATLLDGFRNQNSNNNTGLFILFNIFTSIWAFINILPAVYVQKVLIKRKPFFEASSFGNNEI